jgi:hypothetical protein
MFTFTVHVLDAVVGVPTLRRRFRHRQRREARLVHRCSGLEGTALGGGCGSRHGDLPDMLGGGSDG